RIQTSRTNTSRNRKTTTTSAQYNLSLLQGCTGPSCHRERFAWTFQARSGLSRSTRQQWKREGNECRCNSGRNRAKPQDGAQSTQTTSGTNNGGAEMKQPHIEQEFPIHTREKIVIKIDPDFILDVRGYMQHSGFKGSGQISDRPG